MITCATGTKTRHVVLESSNSDSLGRIPVSRIRSGQIRISGGWCGLRSGTWRCYTHGMDDLYVLTSNDVFPLLCTNLREVQCIWYVSVFSGLLEPWGPWLGSQYSQFIRWTLRISDLGQHGGPRIHFWNTISIWFTLTLYVHLVVSAATCVLILS